MQMKEHPLPQKYETTNDFIDVCFSQGSTFIVVSKTRNVFIIEMSEPKFIFKYFMKAKFRANDCLRCIDEAENRFEGTNASIQSILEQDTNSLGGEGSEDVSEKQKLLEEKYEISCLLAYKEGFILGSTNGQGYINVYEVDYENDCDIRLVESYMIGVPDKVFGITCMSLSFDQVQCVFGTQINLSKSEQHVHDASQSYKMADFHGSYDSKINLCALRVQPMESSPMKTFNQVFLENICGPIIDFDIAISKNLAVSVGLDKQIRLFEYSVSTSLATQVNPTLQDK